MSRPIRIKKTTKRPGYVYDDPLSSRRTSQAFLRLQSQCSYDWVETDLFHQSIPLPSNEPSQASSFHLHTSNISLDGLDRSIHTANDVKHVKNFQMDLNNELGENVNDEENSPRVNIVQSPSVIRNRAHRRVSFQENAAETTSIFSHCGGTDGNVNDEESLRCSQESDVYLPTILINQEYREVGEADYEYGINEFKKRKSRLIVYEPNEPTLCRQYYALNSQWFCYGCKTPGFFKDQVFHAPLHHTDDPLQYSQVAGQQMEILERCNLENYPLSDIEDDFDD